MQEFVVTEGLARLMSAGMLAAVAAAFHVVVRRQEPAKLLDDATVRRRGIKSLVVGTDGRASTSKVQPVLWTLCVFYALLFSLLWGRSVGCDEPHRTPACLHAARTQAAFEGIRDRPLQAEYYVLLGFPYAAAIAAKAMTTAKVANGTVRKPKIQQGQGGFVRGLAEIVSNDSGETDLMDFQYFAFNLIALSFFLIEFSSDPSGGLPDLPPMLVALTGVSTAVYTTKKVLETSGPDRAAGGEVSSHPADEEPA